MTTMNVIYKVYTNERECDPNFPKLKRFFKKEIVESDVDNPHLSILKWYSKKEKGITYSIGHVK